MEATHSDAPRPGSPPASGGRMKFIVGGLLILAAVGYLIISSTQAAAQYFLTVEELETKAASLGSRNVKVSGAVVGDTITYDAQTLTLAFTRSPMCPAISNRSRPPAGWPRPSRWP